MELVDGDYVGSVVSIVWQSVKAVVFHQIGRAKFSRLRV